MKILFTGGGTLGPVTPLLATLEAWKKQDAHTRFVWVGTPHGPERALVQEAGMPFESLPVARFPRYVSIEWLLFPFRFVGAFVKAFGLLYRERPDVIASAGGYTGVPVVLAGWVLGIPSWVHQSDVRPLLSNKITAPFASCITIAWQITGLGFRRGQTKWFGNPVRREVVEARREEGLAAFGLDPKRKTIVVVGGGGGSLWINEQMEKIGGELAKEYQVIHVTGNGKLTQTLQSLGAHYHVFETLTDKMALALAAADVLVSRAGMGAISEAAARALPSIFIPLPNSPQVINTEILNNAQAAVVFDQVGATAQDVHAAILELVRDEKKQQELAKQLPAVLPTDRAQAIVEHVMLRCGLLR